MADRIGMALNHERLDVYHLALDFLVLRPSGSRHGVRHRSDDLMV